MTKRMPHAERGRPAAAIAAALRARTIVVGVVMVAALCFCAPAVAATITVTTNTDETFPNDGTVSLREAIAAIDSGSSLGDPDITAETPGTYGTNDTIRFAPTVVGTQIVLTQNSELALSKPMTIAGPGSAQLVVSGNNTHRVLHITAGAAILSGLTVTGGSLNSGTATDGGAGIAVTGSGSLTLNDVTVSGNTATMSGSVSNQGGAGVFANHGPLTISNSSIIGNTLLVISPGGSEKGGGGLFAHTSALSITGSTISGNSANLAGSSSIGGGGVLIAAGGGTPQLSLSTVAGNRLTTTAGSVTGGGGIFDDAGGLLISQSTLSGNTATVNGGTAVRGGGAVLEHGGTLSLLNSTLAGNTAQVTGGSGNPPGGGAIFAGSDRSNIFLTSSTIAGNAAPGQQGGGIEDGMVSSAPSNGRVFLEDTILAANTAATGANCSGGPGDGSVASLGHNLESANTCGLSAAGDLVNTNPLLGPLGSNGGPAQTEVLLPGSPAVNAGDPSAPACPSTDERGTARPQGPACDIGAVEVVAAAPTVVTLPASAISVGRATLNGGVNANAASTTYQFQWGPTTSYGHSTAVTSAGAGTGTDRVSALITGVPDARTIHYRVVATNALGTRYGVDGTFHSPVPAITQLRLSPGTFTAAGSGPSVTAPPRRPVSTGTLISFTLNEAATVVVTVTQTRPGRLVGSGRHARCLAVGSARHIHRCTRTESFGSFQLSGRAGVNRWHFSGRVGGRALAAGAFTLTAVPTKPAAGRAESRGFRIR